MCFVSFDAQPASSVFQGEEVKTLKEMVRVNTREFEVIFGRKPRGTGEWLFEIGERGMVGEEFMRYGTYTFARRWRLLSPVKMGTTG